ncbi:MAG TPA: hypothetical protein VMD53_15930 [Rhizomicrobium sp.]|nr:hypothetical protein [Rhizomicrobium sp.]
MPKQAVGILIVGVLAALSSGAGAAQQDHGTGKTASQPAPPPPTPVSQATAAGKFAPVSRDVCAKHPNLKQCS